MKKQLWKALSLIICLCLVMTAFAGCGGGDEEVEEPSGNSGFVPGGNDEPETADLDITETIWTVDGITYYFYDDGSVMVQSDGYIGAGEYDWDGTTGYIHIDGTDIFFAVYSDGVLYMEGEDGNQYLMEYVGLTEDVNTEPDTDAPIESGDGWELYHDGDSTYTYYDYNRNVSYLCSDWLTVITGGIGYTTDAVVIGDSEGGYVIIDNVSNEWREYPGEDYDFLCEYVDSYMDEFFPELYGPWDNYTFSELALGDDSHRAAMELNMWNADWDIEVIVILLTTDSGDIMIECIFAPYDEVMQLQTLMDEVYGIEKSLWE